MSVEAPPAPAGLGRIPRARLPLGAVQSELPGLEVDSGPDAAQTRARAVWHALVPVLCPRSRVRIASGPALDTYLRRNTAPVLAHPSRPATIQLYAPDHTGRLTIGDFDAHEGGAQLVAKAQADAQRLVAFVEAGGGRCIVDRSPNGGMHVYIPWERFLPDHELTRLARALHLRCSDTTDGWHATMDLRPATSGVHESLIRPPGAPHRSGGYQELLTPLDQAVRIAENGNPATVYQYLLHELEHELEQVDPPAFLTTADAEGRTLLERILDEAADTPRPRPRRLSQRMLDIAVHGRYDRARYRTPSEARFAVLVQLCARGWVLADIARTLAQGAWPGLHCLLLVHRGAHRSLHDYQVLLEGEVRRVQDYLRTKDQKQGTAAPGENIGKPRPLVQPQPTRGAGLTPETDPTSLARPVISAPLGGGPPFYQWLRSWQTATRELSLTTYRNDTPVRLVLHGLAAMAAHRGEGTLSVGRRALALATGLGDSTVSDALHRLDEDPQAPARLTGRGVGAEADTWELLIPEHVADLAAWRAWRPGPINPIHPVLQILGLSATLVYLELGYEPMTRTRLEYQTGLSERTLRTVLSQLSDHGLAQVDGPYWTRVATPLEGKMILPSRAMINFAGRVAEFRRERAQWHDFLGLPALNKPLTVEDILSAAAAAQVPPESDAQPEPVNPVPVSTGSLATPDLSASDHGQNEGKDEPAPAEDPQDAEMPVRPEPEWLRATLPLWLFFRPRDPEYIDPPEPPEPTDLELRPELSDAQIEALALAAEAIGEISMMRPDDDWVPLRNGRPIRRPGPEPVEWNAAADALGISEATARLLSPSGRRWSRRALDRLLALDPPWRGDDQAAAAEARSRASAAAARRTRELELRRIWAQVLGVDEWQLRGVRLLACTLANYDVVAARLQTHQDARSAAAAKAGNERRGNAPRQLWTST